MASFPLHVVEQNDKIITLGWDPQPGADGYRFYVDGKPVSRTFDPLRTTVKFAAGASEYRVEVLDVTAGAVGVYPEPAPPPPPPPPPPAGALLWKPPVMLSPTTLTVTPSNRVFDLNAGQDYIVKMPSSPLTRNPNRDLPALWLRGGRNVLIVGGEIRIDELAAAGDSNYHQRGLMLAGQSGTAHIEGMWIHGNGMGQAITLDNSRGNAGTVQVQNCRLETMHPVWHMSDGFPNEIHTDTIQSFNGPTVLRLYQNTFISTSNVLQMQPRQYSNHPLGTWDYRRVNFVNTTPDGYALWKQTAVWAEYHEDLWLQTDPRHPWASQHSAWAGNSTCWSCWNPGGSWPITGEAFKIGLRPTDFVPVGAAGVGYVSPGYQ